jgi:D-alanyl-D-alanine carboxypeptidase
MRPRLGPTLMILAVTAFPAGAAVPGPSAATSVHAFVESQARARRLSGTVLIQRDGAAAWSRSFGVADRAFGVPIRADTRFRVASITKLFAATIILQLADEGKVALDRPVTTYLPDFPGKDGSRVTIHQLLNHTSGLPQYDRIASLEQALTEGIAQYQRPLTPAAMLKSCCSGDLASKPGSRFDYNNADYIVLGRIIERIDGRPFEASLRARILDPLGLRNSGIAHQSAIVARLAPTYYWRDDKRAWMNDLPFYFENWDAAGAMYSSPADVARFSRALFGSRLVKPASLQAMLKPGLDDYGYGLWSYSFKRGGKTHGVAKRPGRIMGSNAMLYRLRDERITIVILANDNRADLDEFAQRIAEKLVDQPPSASSE